MVVILFPGATTDGRLTAAAAALGGLIGAAGTALAVYLTLGSQRRDEAEKIESALRMEVAEFARLALGALGVCEQVLAGGPRAPLRDLPALMAIPEAVVYRATADRISRLRDGSLFVVFHARIAEVVQMVAVYSVTGRSFLTETRRMPEPAIPDATARLLATGWFDVCMLAKSILRQDVAVPKLADAAIAASLTDLDAAYTRVSVLLDSPAASP